MELQKAPMDRIHGALRTNGEEPLMYSQSLHLCRCDDI